MKNNSFRTMTGLQKSAFVLFLLAICDSIFTDFGIRHSYISEANPVMRFVYETSVFYFHTLKISLPVLLLFLMTKVKSSKTFQLLIGAALALYLFVLGQHLFWMAVVVSL